MIIGGGFLLPLLGQGWGICWPGQKTAGPIAGVNKVIFNWIDCILPKWSIHLLSKTIHNRVFVLSLYSFLPVTPTNKMFLQTPPFLISYRSVWNYLLWRGDAGLNLPGISLSTHWQESGRLLCGLSLLRISAWMQGGWSTSRPRLLTQIPKNIIHMLMIK